MAVSKQERSLSVARQILTQLSYHEQYLQIRGTGQIASHQCVTKRRTEMKTTILNFLPIVHTRLAKNLHPRGVSPSSIVVGPRRHIAHLYCQRNARREESQQLEKEISLVVSGVQVNARRKYVPSSNTAPDARG